MSRRSRVDPAMAAAMLGLQQSGAGAAAVALALVTYTRTPWRAPTDAALDRARATAERFRISADLVEFVPAEPIRFSGRSRKDAFQGVIIALKQLDGLEGDARVEGIAQLGALLGSVPR